jgi:hypothetical protein
VIVMAEHRACCVPWLLPAYRGYLQETPYRYTSPAALADTKVSCRPARGGTDAPFFLLNNWVESSVPSPADAAKVNAFPALMARARTCEDERGHIPNLVAVDFYDEGDVRGVVRALNHLSE